MENMTVELKCPVNAVTSRRWGSLELVNLKISWVNSLGFRRKKKDKYKLKNHGKQL